MPIPAVSFSQVYLDERILHAWDPFLDPRFVLHHTPHLLFHAHRAFWEFYLPRIDRFELDSEQSLANIQDDFLRRTLNAKKQSGQICWRDQTPFNRQEIVQSVDPRSIFCIFYEEDARRAQQLLKDPLALGGWNLPRPVDCALIPGKLSQTQIEPAWRIIRQQMGSRRPQLFLSMLGWEKTVLAPRLLDTFGVSHIDMHPLLHTPRGKRSGIRSLVGSILRKTLKRGQ